MIINLKRIVTFFAKAPLRYISIPRSPVLIVLAVLCLVWSRSGAAQVAVNRVSSSVHYISTKLSTNNMGGMYAAYRVQNNTGTAQDDVWVEASGFTGGVVGLATGEDGVIPLGAMADGETKMAYVYLVASDTTTTPQAHTITVYDARPDRAGASVLGSVSFTIDEVATSISSSANKVDVVVHGPDPATLGGVITMTVEGRTGTVGAGDILAFSAASDLNWPATTYRLFSSEVTFIEIQGSKCSSTELYTASDSLRVVWGQTACYRAIYQFVAAGTITTPTNVSPIVHVASGTQIKHTDASNFSTLSPIPPVDNQVTLSKSADTVEMETGGTVTYTVTLSHAASNAGCPSGEPTCNDATLQDIVDTLPTSPAMPAYVAGSSTYDGLVIDDPEVSSNVLTWAGSFVVPAGGTATLAYDVTIPDAEGSYLNSVVGHVGSEQIDGSTSVGSLPVELIAFEALADGRDVLLTWSTASETNNAGFYIEQQAEDGLFARVDFVEGQGTTEQPQTYRYRAEGLVPGRYRFRLKQIDYDGTFDYSPEVEVAVALDRRLVVESVYPNPFAQTAVLRFAMHRSEPVRVELFDVLGRRVGTLYAGAPDAGAVQRVQIDGSGLPGGLYLVRLSAAGLTKTRAVLLAR